MESEFANGKMAYIRGNSLVNETEKPVQRYFPKLQDCRGWYADAKFNDEHGGINASSDMTVTAWFNYWIDEMKGNSIRPNTTRDYKERFENNTGDCIGNVILSDVKPIHCQNARTKTYVCCEVH